MEETETKQTNRSLLRPEMLDRIRDSLALLGYVEMSDALVSQVRKRAAYLERCSQQAEAVLYGDLGATDRLWLLLKEPVSAGSSIPQSILDEITRHSRLVEPRAIAGDVLLRLIAGVVRAANQPVEADVMLYSLRRLLEPLFLLDLVVAATESAEHGDLQTLATACWSPQWRAALTEVCGSELAPKPDDINRPVFNADRVPFDRESWANPPSIVEFPFPLWKVWICPGNIRKSMSQIDRFGPRYTIESISNPQACKGHTITIYGRDFGPTGRVHFPRPGVHDPAFDLDGDDPGILIGVEPTRWTDTEIDVVVPPWATSGELFLNAFTRHGDRCAIIDVYRLGNTIPFLGGLARVLQVSIAGNEVDLTSSQPTTLVPGDAVALTWRASVGPTVRVRIRLILSGKVLWERPDLPGGFGGVVLQIPVPETPSTATLEFTATSDCGAVRPLNVPVLLSVPPRLTIQYVEVTQGVQGDLADILAGRAMPTVANKDTAVRVHMHCDRGGWYFNKLDNITGALFVDGHKLSPTNVRNVIPDRGFASISGLSNPERTNDTLNFTIPGAWITPGTHTLTVHVICNDPSGKVSVDQSFPWTWLAKSPLRVRAIWMGIYPPIEFMLDYTRSVLDFLPTPLTDIGIAHPSAHKHFYDLSILDGWEDLIDDLEDLWDDFDEESGVRWLGIVPPNEPGNRPPFSTLGISGTPSIAVLAMGDRPDSGAHELGHSLGLNHINQPPGKQDEPYDTVDSGGMLRRPPFDVRPSTAVSLPAVDLMGYPPLPVRPGITTWLRLFNMNF